jgi:hypothetical protein
VYFGTFPNGLLCVFECSSIVVFLTHLSGLCILLQTESETSCEEAARLTAEGAADDDDEAYDYGAIPPPPDGGYGWVVVFASFMCNLVVDGIAYTFGIFLPELVTFFGEGKGTVAWVGSLLSGVYLAAGKLFTFISLTLYSRNTITRDISDISPRHHILPKSV